MGSSHHICISLPYIDHRPVLHVAFFSLVLLSVLAQVQEILMAVAAVPRSADEAEWRLSAQ